MPYARTYVDCIQHLCVSCVAHYQDTRTKRIERYRECIGHQTRMLMLEARGYVKANVYLEVVTSHPGTQLCCPSDLLVKTVSWKMREEG